MRIRYIDLVKGISIILMIFGHTMTKVNVVHTWIYSFHMPLFFIVCGVLINIKEQRTVYFKNKKIGDVIVRRIYAVGIPYLCFGSILAFFYSALDIIAREPLSFGKRMFELLTLQGIDSLWFLPIYLLSYIIMLILGNLDKYKELIRVIVAGISFIIICLATDYMTSWYTEIVYKVLIGICFVEIGYLVAKSEVVIKMSVKNSLLFCVMGYIIAQINGDVEMTVGCIGNPILYFVSATMTTIALMALLKKCENRTSEILKIIEIYGKNTLVLLVTNNLIIETIRLLDYKITGNILIRFGIFGSGIFSVMLLVFEWWLIKLANGILAPMFGYAKIKDKGEG